MKALILVYLLTCIYTHMSIKEINTWDPLINLEECIAFITDWHHYCSITTPIIFHNLTICMMLYVYGKSQQAT